MTSPFPTPDEVPADAGAERAVTGAIELISGLRSMRQEAGLPPAAPLVLAVTGGGDAEALRAQAGLIERLGHARIDGDRPGGVPLTVGDARVGVHGEGLADRVRDRLRRQVETARAELGKAERKLADDRFVQRAPAAVVAEERLRADRFGRELEELARRLDELAG
jgi:valyl-tRNA synthetase